LIKQSKSGYFLTYGILLAISLMVGAIIPMIFNDPNWMVAWLISSLIIFISTLLLYVAWKFGGSGRPLAWFLALAFLVRILAGIITEAGLPVWGYDEKVQKSGYLFYDAYKRDNDAWALAKSDQSLFTAFQNEFVGDQYGGLLSFSALIYRNLSPDQHRPYLVMLLTALAGSLAVSFVWTGAEKRWGKRVAVIAASLVAFYPDAIFFGASQMREPFLVLFIASMFWGVIFWGEQRKKAISVIVLSILGIFLVSYRVAMPAMAVLAGWFLLERLPRRRGQKSNVGAWIVIILAALVMCLISWNWLISTSSYEIFDTIKQSGRVNYVFKTIPEQYKVPFVIMYGLTQPVLPAAIVDTSLPIWQTIAILRGVGWYAIAALLVYAFIAIWKAKDPADRRILAWLSVCIIIWLLVSSARAGGDQWDNPRYRSIFLVFIALLCGWAWDYAVRNKDAWLARFYLIEGIFLGFFLEWYISRYFQTVGRLPFEKMLMWVAGLSFIVLTGGVVWDRIRKKQLQRSKKG
jgi:hypothetical protein